MLVAHLSDLHLGRASPGDPHGAERLTSFRAAVAALAGHNPDALVIAGDTFDNPQVDEAIVEESARILRDARKPGGEPLPIVVIPGNHDPAAERKLWATFQNQLAGSDVRLALAAELLLLCDGKLVVEAYPCPTRFSAAAPWENRLSLPELSDAVHVVVAHGTLQGGPVPEGETDAYPFSQADVEALGADYVAFGHFHGLYPPWPNTDQIERSFCYCGTHEPDQFGSDAGYALLATLKRGKPTRLQRLRVGKRQWRLLEVDGPAQLARLEELRKEVAASADPGRYVVRLKIDARAAWPAVKIEQFARLESALRALGAQVERRGDLQAQVDIGTLDLAGLPSGAVKEALLTIQAELGSAADGEREVLTAALQIGWGKLRELVTS